MRTKWLNRSIGAPGPHLCLCLSEEEFLTAIKRLKPPTIPDWMKSSHADATVHSFYHLDNLACIVCLRGFENQSTMDAYGLLVHESVHIWQQWCEYYGEEYPGLEQEAYTIQSISQNLMTEFNRRMEKNAETPILS